MSNYSSSIIKTANIALYKSYCWMSLGLIITSIIAYLISGSIQIQTLIFNSSLLNFGIILAQIGVIIFMSTMIQKLSYLLMLSLFIIYSLLNGLTLSAIFMIFNIQSIIGVFFIASGIFIIMASYGILTKHDLSSYGTFGLAILSGVLILSIFNIFFKSGNFDYILSFISVIAISALIAYDMQNTKKVLIEMAYDKRLQNKMSIYAALSMYINFISLFIRLLHLFGKKKD